MAYSKARRLSDSISATGEISSFVDASIVPADLHSTLDLTGKTITVATASASDNDTTVASTAFVQQELASLVDSAPGTLNTLNELAAALGDDASFSTTVTNSIATKLPLAGGTLTGGIVVGGDTSINRGNQTSGELLLGGTTDGGFVDFDGTNLQLNTQRDPNTGTFVNTGKSNARIEISGPSGGSHIAFRTASANNTSAAERMRIDSSGHIGIGRTPESDIYSLSTISLGNGSMIYASKSGNEPNLDFLDNAFLNSAGNFEYQRSGKSTKVEQYNGTWTFANAPSGTAGATASFTERMRITSAGNVGIGVAPETTYSAYTSIEFGQQGAIIANDAADDFGIKVNTYLDSAGNWKRKETGVASSLDFDGDQWKFFTAASGSADANISFAQKLRIDNDGIKFGSDTAAANALDDYEEGNFTPIFSCAGGSAPSSQTGTGQYTKIGDVVHLTGQINWSGSGSGGSNLRIAIPFNVISDARAGLAIGLNSGLSYTADYMLHLIPEINTNVVYIVDSPHTGTGHNHLNFSNVKSTGSTLFSFSGSFHTRD